MSKHSKAREFARKKAAWWIATNAAEVKDGRPEFSLENMLGAAWGRGYDAGQNHQRELQKANPKDEIVVATVVEDVV